MRVSMQLFAMVLTAAWPLFVPEKIGRVFNSRARYGRLCGASRLPLGRRCVWQGGSRLPMRRPASAGTPTHPTRPLWQEPDESDETPVAQSDYVSPPAPGAVS